jgi:hypothetical protein
VRRLLLTSTSQPIVIANFVSDRTDPLFRSG